MRWQRGAGVAVAALLGFHAPPSLASGGPEPHPSYIDHHGGTTAERAALYRGRLGVVMARSHAPLLYVDWRLLHGLEVGPAAGEALAASCCGEISRDWSNSGRIAWQEARRLVPGVDPYVYVPTDRPGPNYTTTPNCFPDAFESAAATLRDRVAQHGAGDPAVRAWLRAQDAVFDACANAAAAFPAAMAGAPAWLRADRSYQEAAFSLYNFRNYEAAARFAAIARDRSSPWRARSLYLVARTTLREALANPNILTFAVARALILRLSAMPESTYGRDEAVKMLRALDYRDRPAGLLEELDAELSLREPAANIEISLRDYLSLGREAGTRPDAADWILTMQSVERVPALDHARARWQATRDPAWLVAALAMADPQDDAAGALAADAARVEPGHPAWKTARYHLIRLTIATAGPETTRERLDALLARGDLTLSERNMLGAARAQLATGLGDFARHALRRPYCGSEDGGYCVQDGWAAGDRTLARGRSAGEFVGLGPDALAVIDRLPLEPRIALSRDAQFPANLRMDIALTSFARAVQLQDAAAVDGLAADLAVLLPQMRADWLAIAASRPGPAKAFATYFAMAKIPGLRTDLADYRRPQGSVRQFQGYWVDWMIVPRGRARPAAEFPPSARYMPGNWYFGDGEGNDLTCLRECGPGSFPLRLPEFAERRRREAAGERGYFVTSGSEPQPAPGEARSIWDETLAYARSHPRDPRSPETLYWLIRIARWGGNHNHLGRRAFALLHRRYPGSDWARRSPYHYDG